MIVLEHRDFKVRTVDGVNIAVRETRAALPMADRTPIVLLHGTAPTGAAAALQSDTFAEALARAGHVCFSVDMRGFGKSDAPTTGMRSTRRPASMVHSIEMARDLDAAANELRKVSGRSKVGIIQWGAPAGIVYAALWPEKVSHLVLCDMAADSGVDAPSLQPDLAEQGDAAGQGDTVGDGQTATLTRRLALHDLAPAAVHRDVPDAVAMNYANHIFCKVMIVEAGERSEIDEDGVSRFHGDFIRAREIFVRPPDTTESASNGGLARSLTEFLR